MISHQLHCTSPTRRSDDDLSDLSLLSFSAPGVSESPRVLLGASPRGIHVPHHTATSPHAPSSLHHAFPPAQDENPMSTAEAGVELDKARVCMCRQHVILSLATAVRE